MAEAVRVGVGGPVGSGKTRLVERLLPLLHERGLRVAVITNDLVTKEDAERYVQDMRERIQRAFGPWPEKTALNPQVTGVVERDAYHIEKVIFESRPRFYVTANLYIPKERKFPLPGVVGSCGHRHHPGGVAAAVHQSPETSINSPLHKPGTP